MAKPAERRGGLTRAQRMAWRAFFEAHHLLTEQIEADLTAAGVGSLVDYDVLLALYEAPERKKRLAELADAVLISRSGLTRLVDRLEARGLLRRESCPSDRRGSYAALTDAGLEEMRRIWAVYARGIGDYYFAHLSDEEVETVRAVSLRVRDGLRARKSGKEEKAATGPAAP